MQLVLNQDTENSRHTAICSIHEQTEDATEITTNNAYDTNRG